MKFIPVIAVAIAVVVGGCRREAPAYNDYPMKLGASDVSHTPASK